MSEMNGNDKLLQPDERQKLEEFAQGGSEDSQRRRARILLLYDQGQPTREVARAAGLSRSCVRYWRAKFRRLGMEIFPALGGSAQFDVRLPEGYFPVQAAAPATGILETTGDESVPALLPAASPSPGQAEPGDVVVRREQFCTLAFALFDGLQPVHRMAPAQRRLLEATVRLSLPPLPDKKNAARRVIRETIQAQNAVDVSIQEQDLLAALLALHTGKIRPKALPGLGLPEAEQQQAIALAAMLDIAASLNQPGSLQTRIQRVERAPGGWWVIVTGPQAQASVAAAQASADSWSKAGYPDLRVLDASEAKRELAQYPQLIKPVKNPGLLPSDPLSEAGRKLMRFLFAEMLRHEAGTRLGEDIEALHDMRVATRRLRAAFEVFQDAFKAKALKPYLQGLRAAGRALGGVRDLDVFMEKAQHYLATLPEGQRQGLDPLLDDWKSQRDSAREQMLAHLDGETYQSFKWAFNQFLSTPGAGARTMDVLPPLPSTVSEIAPVLVYSRLGEVRAFESALPNAPIELLHALRIQFKKLRYTVEFFREVLGEEARGLITDLKTVQDHLGDLNDADVATGILKTFLDEWDSAQAGLPVSQRQNPEAIVTYLAARHSERYRLMVTFPQTWEYFNRPEFRRNLALAVSVL